MCLRTFYKVESNLKMIETIETNVSFKGGVVKVFRGFGTLKRIKFYFQILHLLKMHLDNPSKILVQLRKDSIIRNMGHVIFKASISF